MSAAARRRLLVVTPLDWHGQPNNVEHNRVACFLRRGHAVTVVHKRLSRSRRPRDLLLDSLSFRLRREREGQLELLEIDPFFNYFGGLRKDAEERAGGGPPRARLRLIRLLAPLAVLRDLCFVPCALVGILLRVRGRFDAGFGFGAFGGAICRVLRATGRIRLFVQEDHDFEPGLVPDRLRAAYTAALERSSVRHADLVVSIGTLLAERRREETGRTPLVVPAGVDRAAFAAARAAPRGGARLLYVGNLISWCGIEHVLEALPGLAAAQPDVSLRIVGGGLPGYVEHLRRRVAELGITSRVEMPGPRPPAELPALLSEADLGLANSEPTLFRRYASPLKQVEYMAAGLPAVVTEGTEAAEIARRTGSGIAVPYDTRALEDALRALLADPERRRRMSAAAVEASRALDWDDLVAGELERVEDLLRAAPASGAAAGGPTRRASP